MNTRSFHKHAIDIYNDRVLLNTDVLCLTETQILPHQNTNNISEVLTNFNYLHNECDDKFQSLSFCYKSHVEIIDYHHTTGVSIIDFKKTLFSSDPIKDSAFISQKHYMLIIMLSYFS